MNSYEKSLRESMAKETAKKLKELYNTPVRNKNGESLLQDLSHAMELKVAQ